MVPTRAAGDLGHFRRVQPPLTLPVEFRQPGKGDVSYIEVQPHANGIGGDDIIHFARLKQCDLPVARFRAERPHHDGSTAAKPAEHFGHGIDLLGGKRDDGTARGQAAQLARADMCQCGEAGPGDDFRSRHQCPHHRFQRRCPQQQGHFPPARVQQVIGEDVPPLAVGGELRFVERGKRQRPAAPVAAARHRLCRAAEIARIGWFDPFFAGNQGDRFLALDRHHPIIDLACQQAQRKADGAARMRAHPFDRKVRLPGVGRPEDRLDDGIAHTGKGGTARAVLQWAARCSHSPPRT